MKVGGTVSVYVNLMRGEHDDHLKWSFHGDITVHLLNQRRIMWIVVFASMAGGDGELN